MKKTGFSITLEAPVKEILESITTGSKTPEEMLGLLDQYDIDWFVTDKGDLLIRYWQIVAEDFVPREQTARIRQSRPTPTGAETLEWVSRHLDELRDQYNGKWIGVAQNAVVASAYSLAELLEALHDIGIDGAFITQIPSKKVVWRAVYGG